MKNNIKDIFLIPIAFVFNYLFAYIGFVVLTACNQIIVSMNFSESDFDQLMGNLTIKSFEGIIFLFFLYFLSIDLKTLISRNSNQVQEYESLENYSSKGKFLLNIAFNIFKKVPFEYSLKHSIRIYFLRMLLIIIVILPLYLYQPYISLFSLFPFLTALLTLIILLGAALLYQFDTKVGKRIEQYFLMYISWIRPDKLRTLQKRCST